MLFQIFWTTWLLLKNGGLAFWRPLAIPALLMMIYDFVPIFWQAGYAAVFADTLVYLILTSFLATAVHRLAILGPEGFPTQGSRFNLSETIGVFWRMLGLTLVGVLIVASISPFMLYLIDIGFAFIFFKILIYCVTALLVSRFCLVLPSAAVGTPLTFAQSWSRTQDTKMTAAMVFILLPLGLGMATEFLYAEGSMLLQIFWSVVSTALFIVGILFLSQYYRYLNTKPNADIP